VAKTALGRGLGNLLKAANPSPLPAQPEEKPGNLSAGMATLLQGANGVSGPEVPEQPAMPPTLLPLPEAASEATAPSSGPAPSGRWWFRAALILGDLLLVAMAVRLVFRAHGPLGAGDTLLCIGAMAVGGCLSCLALRLGK
jgi:hypothetical protein